LQGAYCHACGEKRLSARDRTVGHVVRDLMGSAFSLDGTFWQTIRLLALRPGALTAEHLAGRRRPYLTPLRLFLLCNLVYFVVQPYTGYQGYNTTLRSQMARQMYSDPAGLVERVARRLDLDHLAPAEMVETERFQRYEVAFNTQSSTYARALVVLLIPLIALLLKALLPRRLLADHLVFATHLMAWQLLVVMSAWLLLYSWVLAGGVYELLPRGVAVYFSEVHTLVFVAVYLYLALRRAYGLGRGAAGWRAALLGLPPLPGLGVAGLMLVLILVYRYVLFWATFWSVVPP
jgi:hypothetical protein